MKKAMWKQFLLAALLGTLASCSSVPRSVEPAQLGSLGTVAYVSMVDDRLILTYQGTTLFENKEQVTQLPALALQAFAAKTLSDVMELQDVKKISAQDYRGDLAPFLKKSRDERIPFKFDFEAAAPVLKKIQENLKADSVLLLYPDAFYEESYTKRTSFREIGVLFRSFIGIKAQFVHTPLTVVLYRFADQTVVAKNRNNRPIDPLEDVSWKDNAQNFSAEELLRMKEALESKLKETLIKEVQDLKLSK